VGLARAWAVAELPEEAGADAVATGRRKVSAEQVLVGGQSVQTRRSAVGANVEAARIPTPQSRHPTVEL
jgi:hypothetical protein